MTMAGCTVYVLTGNNFLRFLWLPLLVSWLETDQLSVTLSTDSEWCLCGVDTLALCAMSCVVVIRCPLLETVLRSLLEPCHLSVSLDEPELALESLPWVVDFSESLPMTTTDSFSLLNLERGHIGYMRRIKNIQRLNSNRKPNVLELSSKNKMMF